MSRVNVIDLFAGPGGLGEGFSAYTPELLGREGSGRGFKIRLSIEMDKHAHQTLLLRSFLRQFEGDFPDEYYEFYRGDLTLDELKDLPKFEKKWIAARKEVGGRELKMGDNKDDKAIEVAISELQANANKSDQWVVIGGPPCQAFSSVGRVRNMAKPDYQQTKDERIYAYIEYLKILDQVRPDCFILENVEGMLQTAPDGEPIFPTILRHLQDPTEALREMGNDDSGRHSARERQEYQIFSATGDVSHSTDGRKYLVPIADYGVPQERKRVILIGVRSGLANRADAAHIPQLSPFVSAEGRVIKISVGEAIGDLPAIRSRVSMRNFYGSKSKDGNARRLGVMDCYINGFLAKTARSLGRLKAAPKATLTTPMRCPPTTSIAGKKKAAEQFRLQHVDYRSALQEMRASLRLPVDSKELWLRLLKKNAGLVSRWSRGRFSVRDLVNNASEIDDCDGGFIGRGKEFCGPQHLENWLLDPFLSGVNNHESRQYKGSDLLRYLYFSVNGGSVKGGAVNLSLQDIPEVLQPDHANADSGHFSDRFRVFLEDKPAKTITCHLGKDGHAFIHYDPVQCRAISVREAARLQTFPDNYVFCGPVSQQRKQVGNAVPPWFAVQLAGLVDQFLDLERSSDAANVLDEQAA